MQRLRSRFLIGLTTLFLGGTSVAGAASLPGLTFPSQYWRVDAATKIASGVAYQNPQFPRQIVTVVREPTTLDARTAAASELAALQKRGVMQLASHDIAVCGSVPATVFDFGVTFAGSTEASLVEEVLSVENGMLSRVTYFRPAAVTPAPGLLAALKTGCVALPKAGFRVTFAPPHDGVWVERRAAGAVRPGTHIYESEQYRDQRIALFAVTTPMTIEDYVRTHVRPSIHVPIAQRNETICGSQPAIVVTYATKAPDVAIDEVITRIGAAIVGAAAFRPTDAAQAPGVAASIRSLCAG
jgi:hypothetical protein